MRRNAGLRRADNLPIRELVLLAFILELRRAMEQRLALHLGAGIGNADRPVIHRTHGQGIFARVRRHGMVDLCFGDGDHR